MSDLDCSILTAFIGAAGEPVSGDRLAKELGVSRVAIWNRLQRMREAGYDFAASPRRGYTLVSVPRFLNAPLLGAHLRRLKVSMPVTLLAEVDSTNAEATRQLATGHEAPFAILAQMQTAGRGRLGRKWHNAAKGNLYLSLAFRPFIAPERLKAFTLWMGLKLCSHLHNSFGIRLGLKWPNDVLSPDGRKIAGMLTEARIDADWVRELVFGLGLNWTGAPENFPAEIRNSASSLEMALERKIELNLATAELIAALSEAWEKFANDSWSASLGKLWREHDVLTGKSIQIGLRGEPMSGVVEGIDSAGSLILRSQDGRKTIVSSGEVTLLG